MKEGIFGGIYYALYIEGKSMGMNSFSAGMIAGIASTLFTHPFEIVRANMQVQIIVENGNQLMEVPLTKQLLNLGREGELLKGVTPRLIKKPLANTMTFLLFEAMENTQNKDIS